MLNSPDILYNLNNSESDRKSLNSLIEICFKIAQGYVRVNFQKVFRQLVNEQESIEDIAIDSISPLFLSNGNDELQIKRIFRKWGSNVTSEQDALFFLNQIVSRRVNQHITQILKDSDPFFAKIYESVTYLIKRDGYKKKNYFGTVYIVEKEIKNSPIEPDAFYNLPAELFVNKDKILKNLLKYLKNETEFFPAIPLNALVKKIKQISFDTEYKTSDPGDATLKYELIQIVDWGLNKSKKKLLDSYGREGKLKESEIESFEKTLNDIAYDLKNGGLKPGLYEYLRFNMPDLKRDVFRTKYQNILEYLFKVMKHKVAEELKK